MSTSGFVYTPTRVEFRGAVIAAFVLIVCIGAPIAIGARRFFSLRATR